MKKLNQRSISRRLGIIIFTLAILAINNAVIAENWSYFKLPGGVHHKTAFIDHTSIQGMFSICMSDSLCFKEWNSTSGDWDDWEFYGFLSTWGLDCAVIDGSPKVMVGGKGKFEIYKYGSGWLLETEDYPVENEQFHYHDCVFYGSTLDLEQVLISRRFDTAYPDYEDGLYYWRGSPNYDWKTIDHDDSPPYDHANFGGRMLRSAAEGEYVMMLGPISSASDRQQLYSVDTGDFGSSFDIYDCDWFTPSGYTVNYVAAFNQWEDADNNVYVYVVASTTDNSSNTTIDIWVKTYTYSSSSWGNWEKVYADLSRSSWMQMFDPSDDGIADAFIACRPYDSGAGTEHRIYMTSREYGLIAFNTVNGPNTEPTLVRNETSDGYRQTAFRSRWLDINPLSISTTVDEIIVSTEKAALQVATITWSNGSVTGKSWNIIPTNSFVIRVK